MRLILVFIAALSMVAAAEIASLQATYSSQGYDTTDSNAPIAFYTDTIVAWGQFQDGNFPAVGFRVFREKNGQYINIANVASEAIIDTIFNNGNWIGGFSSDVIQLFQLDANNAVINRTEMQVENGMRYPTLLSDNSIVYLDSTSNFTTLVLQSNGSWTPHPTRLAAPYLFATSPSYRHVYIDDKSLVYFNVTSILIHTRQSDSSWLRTEVFAFQPPFEPTVAPFHMHYNGIDSLALVYTQTYFNNTPTLGFAVFCTKINNDWKYQVITSFDFGLSATSMFGQFGITVIDENTLALGAPFDGVQFPTKRAVNGGPPAYPLGKVVVVQRRGNTWIAAAKISPIEPGLLGYSAGITNNHLIALRARNNGFDFDTVPRCVFAPINATCFDVDVSTCQIDVSNTDAYEITQCSDFEVRSAVTNANVKNNSLSVTFEFDRVLSPTVTCSSVLSCPVPPTAVIVAPSPKSVSSASIVSSFMSLVLLLVVLF